MDGVKPLGWIKADTDILEHAVKAEGKNAQPEAEEATKAMQEYIERGERRQ